MRVDTPLKGLNLFSTKLVLLGVDVPLKPIVRQPITSQPLVYLPFQT